MRMEAGSERAAAAAQVGVVRVLRAVPRRAVPAEPSRAR